MRKRTKNAKAEKDKDVEMVDATASSSSGPSAVVPAESDEGKGKEVASVELQDEPVYREKEAKELDALVDADLRADVGCSVSGLYDLVGSYILSRRPNSSKQTNNTVPLTAIVTHKGAAADAGHYMAYVKKSVFHPVSHSSGTKGSLEDDDDDWYKFDDNKVSVFPKEKLATLDGGGEDSSAYVLLYKTKALA